jgi:hypothetical protein
MLVDLLESPLHFCEDLLAREVIEPDVEPVATEPGARERREMFGCRVAFGPVQRNVFVEVVMDQRPLPCLQQSSRSLDQSTSRVSITRAGPLRWALAGP